MSKNKHKVNRELFTDVIKRGGRTSTSFFLIRYNNEDNNKDFKFTIVIPKKIENKAVNRNSSKRRVYHAIKEVARQIEKPLKKYTVIFFTKCSLKKISFGSIKEDVEKALSKLNS